MRYSAGIIIKCMDKILLVKSSSGGVWCFPKGEIKKGESKKEAAIRETLEEVGLNIPKGLLGKKYVVDYKDKKGKKYKEVTLFLVEIDNMSNIDLLCDYLPQEQLQLEEIEEARMISIDDAKEIIFWRFRDILDKI